MVSLGPNPVVLFVTRLYLLSKRNRNMQYDTFLAGAYQIEKTLEISEYSVLGRGKKLDTGLPVMLRLWLTAHATTVEEQEHIQAEVASFHQPHHSHLFPLMVFRS